MPPDPKVLTIAAGRPFVEVLARGLLTRHGADPLALAQVKVLLPNRRAVRALRDAFLRVTDGRALLLPDLRPIGDVDEDELALSGLPGLAAGDLALAPAITPLGRQLILTRLLLARGDLALDAAAATRLAGDLGRLLDQIQAEDLDLDRLDGLVPDRYARHWQHTLDFLGVLRTVWPTILAERGQLDAVARRSLAIRALAQHWRTMPPSEPIYAAGSTGSLPATAELLGVIARLPAGAVVLPGFDRDLSSEAAHAAGSDPTHPQHGMLRLLDRIGVTSDAIDNWDDIEPTGTARSALIRRALYPADLTDQWPTEAPVPDDAFAGLSRIEALGPREEAEAIALLLRQALETPAKTAALVTPDRDLARRVSAELRRWDIDIDDSAGRPLAAEPPATLIRALLDAAQAAWAPVELLALLKHPLCAAGRSRGAHLAMVRALDRALRGPRPAPGLAGIRATVAGSTELEDWIDRLTPMLAPLAAPNVTGLAGLVDVTVMAAEALAGDDTATGAARLWRGDAGDALRRFFQDLAASAADLPELALDDWPGFLDSLLDGQVIRPSWGTHPRLFIWGQLEARLQQADLLVLGGLNEGTWPADIDPGPWFSRPMRQSFGLPPLEQRIGQAAHDFAQAAAAPTVVLSRAVKVGGAQTVPSRWLLRLGALLGKDPRWSATRRTDVIVWAEIIDRPAEVRPVAPPRPTPPVALRPRSLSVTRIERLLRDPYAIYAQSVLRLKPWDRLDADPGAADRGTRFHQALDRWMADHRDTLPDDAVDRLIAFGEEALADLLARPSVRAFWLPRFRRIAAWFVAFERDRRQSARTLVTEIKGKRGFDAPGGPFVLTGTADRIDRRQDGKLAILDYKTGQMASKKQVLELYAPQLPLEAAIAQAGGFPGVPAGPVAELMLLRLTGGSPEGEARSVSDDIDNLARRVWQELQELITRYDDPTHPYLSHLVDERRDSVGDYDHLARVREWRTAGTEEET